MEIAEKRFHWLDYLTFFAMLLASAGIGLYHSCTGGKQRTTDEYLVGNRQMSLIPVTISATVTYVSTITILGYPAEIFAFGGQYWLGVFGMVIGATIACLICVPVFHPLKLTSVNEYILLRFESRTVMYIATFSTLFAYIFFNSSLLYGPSTAIQAVAGLPTWVSILIGSIVAIFYTTIGGFKAVIWADVFQSIVMILGMIAIFTYGAVSMGGIGNIMSISDKWGRLELLDIDPDPTKRMSLWSSVFGSALSWVGVYGYAQVGVQRYASLSTLNQARLCVLGIIPGSVFLASLAFLCGFTVFAHYMSEGCDPVKAGFINNYNQILPYYVVDVLNVPGVVGIFIAVCLAASLSSISSALSAISANIWCDVIKHHYPHISERRATFINKMIVLVIGVTCTFVAFLFDIIGGTLLQMIVVVCGAATGPVSSLFIIGAFFPFVNKKGALAGICSGLIMGAWLSIGSLMTPKNWTPLPSTVDNCTYPDDGFGNMTTVVAMTTMEMAASTPVIQKTLTGLQKFYSLSFMWHREVYTGTSLVIAFVVSALTGLRKSKTVDARLVHPLTAKAFNMKAKEGDLYAGMGYEKVDDGADIYFTNVGRRLAGLAPHEANDDEDDANKNIPHDMIPLEMKNGKL